MGGHGPERATTFTYNPAEGVGDSSRAADPPSMGVMGLRIPPRQWQISAEGFEIGPHDEPSVVAAIERGQLSQGHCRLVGDLRWRKIAEEPRFAEAVRRAAVAI